MAGYKQDSRLLANPNRLYSADWVDFDRWYGFLGTAKKDFYPTIEKASEAAIALGLNSIAEYKAAYKQDARLPACPETVYRNDWAGFGMWSGFLGFDIKNIYSTIQKASETAIALGFTSVKEGYKKDTRLQTSPSNRYSDDWADLGGWSQFLK